MTDAPVGRAALIATDVAAGRPFVDALWRAYDRCRGVLDVTEFGDVVLTLLYLRDRPVWRAVVEDGRDLEWALIEDVSGDLDRSTLMRPLLDPLRKIDRGDQLTSLIDLVSSWHPDGGVPMSYVFSAFIDVVRSAAGRRSGEFHTPGAITELAAALVDPTPNDRVLDPFCRAGEFPAAIADRLAGQGRAVDGLSVDLADYSMRSSALAFLGLRLRKIAPRVLPTSAETLPTGVPGRLYDVVATNPPFNYSGWDFEGRSGGRWRYGVPPAHNANFAWLQYVVASLDRGGRAVVVMPHGAGLSANPQEQSIRAAMLDDGVVSTVIALPGQMFATTDIPVTLWLLRPSGGDRPGDVLFVDATGRGTVRHRGRRTLDRPDINAIVDVCRLWREGRPQSVDGFAVTVPVSEIRAGGYRLNPREYVRPVDSHSDPGTRAGQVAELTQRLDRLAEQADLADQVIQEYLKELSL
ncbi:class I SAM-dependent DNA methyltransferase [Dactylosporangium sp. NPDC005555]|uniref:class I SAM-dependent DNA methyltransferase n=1 Tax=Dactylosporangium sp. NPDC005555 TaxID=3154889 RepID=UPI0033ABE5AE